MLGSHDSVTGAPEKHQGEAVEQEASNFVASFAHIALSSATGKHEQGDPGSDPFGDSVPDPTRMAVEGAQAKDSTSGASSPVHHDKTKQPMEEAMWTKMRPIMHVVGEISDGWERFAKYAVEFFRWIFLLNMAQRSLSDASFPTRDTTVPARCSTCPSGSDFAPHHVCYVYEDDHILNWLGVLRRSYHLACS